LQKVLAMPEGARTTPEQWSARASAAAVAGFKDVEVPSDAPADWIARLSERGLRVAVVRCDPPNGEPLPARLSAAALTSRQAAWQRLTSQIGWTAEVGGSVATVAPAAERSPREGRPFDTYPEALYATLESLRKLIGPTSRTGVTLAVEAAADRFLVSPMECRDLLDELNWPGIGACLDLARIAGVGWCGDWIRTLRHRIVCVRCTAETVEQTGGVCFPEPPADWAAALAEVGYAGPVVVDGDPRIAAQAAARLGCGGAR